METKLKDKVAIVTGASKGIGAGIAKALGLAGAAVIVNYASGESDANKVVNKIQSEGGKAIAIQADMSKSNDVKRMFEQAKVEFGTIDILVNNAGVAVFEMVADLTEEAFHKQFNLNVLGYLLATQQAVKHMSDHGGIRWCQRCWVLNQMIKNQKKP